MSNSPHPNPAPDEEHSTHRSSSILLGVAAGLGVIAAAGAIVAVVWGDRLIETQVLPRVEAQLAETIGRPIDLGQVEGIFIWGVRLENIVIPPTDTDESTVTVETAELDFALRPLLFQQTIEFDLRLLRPEVILVQEVDARWLDLVLPEPPEGESQIGLEIQSLTVEDASVTALTRIQDAAAAVIREPVEVTEVGLVATFRGIENQQVDFEASGQLDSGRFELLGEGDLNDKAIQTNVRLQSLPLRGVNLVLPSAYSVRSGRLNANLTVAADLTEDNELNTDTVDLQGTARFQEGEVLINELPAPVSNIRSQLRFQGQQVTLEDTALQLADMVLTAEGTVDRQAGYDLRAQIPTIAISDVQSLADLELPVAAAGSFQLNAQVTGDLEAPQVRGQLTNRGTVQVDQVELAAIAADFALNQERFDLRELRVVPETGGVVVAQGQADITDWDDPRFQLTAQVDLPVDPFAELYGVTLPAASVIGTLTADVDAEGTLEAPTAVAQWQLSESSFPGQGVLTLVNNRLVLDQTRLQVADGTITANAIANLATGDWQATATTSQVPIQQFTREARGLLSANLNAAGNLSNFDLATLQASGDATIANAILQPAPASAPLLPPGDWTTEFEWLGDRIAVRNFSAPNLQADGTIGVDFSRDIPIGELALDVALQDFDLQPLNRLLPEAAQEYGRIAGLTSFTGQLTGTLDNPQLDGNARLVDLAVNRFTFERLSGPVNFSLAAGGEIDLQGGGDRVSLVLNADPWPVAFEIRNQDLVASGTGVGRSLDVDIEQFPLDRLDVQPAANYGFGAIAGLVDLSLTADLTDFSNPSAMGTLTVREPGLAPVAAELFTTDFRYANNTAILEQGELLLEDSRFLLSGSVTLQPAIAYDAQLTVAEGHIEDLVVIAQTIDLDALRFGLDNQPPRGNAADLGVPSVRLPMATFLEQLEAFVAYAETLPADSAVAGQPEIPPLDTLMGEFTGGVSVAGRSLDFTALTADFNFSGQDWEWGSYDPPNRFIVSGNVEEATVTLDPVSIMAGETVVNLTGSGSLADLEGELLVDNLPVELAAAFYPLPVDVEGDLDITSQFGGSLAHPRIEGQLLVANPVINEQPLDRVVATFDYRNAVLAVEGEAAIDPADAPMTLTGTIPYALPIMTVQPPTDQINLTAIVPEDTFDFINVLTADEVRWEGGDGEIIVQIGGTVSVPVVAGTATFQDGIVTSPELGDPLTDITGQVQFNLERVDIPRLQARIGDGTVAIAGQLPLQLSGEPLLAQFPTPSTPPPETAPPDGILIALGELPLDYRGILDAELDGQVTVAGAVLDPTIRGGVELSNGQIHANQLLRQAGALNLPTSEEVQAVNPYRAEFLGIDPLAPQPTHSPAGILDRVSLDEFGIVFSDRLVVSGQPFYNVTADGGLVVNGPLSDLRPEGEVDLRTGWINLFSTQFRLDTSAPNSAIFNPADGLNPYLDVVLTARVRDTDVTRIPPFNDGFASSEISDNDIQSVGNVEFINVQASVMGYASELDESLALTSNPARSEEELVALLGSSVAGGLASANLTQVAGFVGAGGIAGFGNNLADALGLRSFSIFPTTDTSTESTAGIGIGVEASFAIGDSIGISVLEILNSGNPPQIGLQYRITDDLQLRGSSNLNDTEVRLEYRTDF